MSLVECKLDCSHTTNIAPTEVWQILNTLPTHCEDCLDVSENWICLTCASTFCSRFIHGHAADHAASSGHSISLSLSDLSVWCYPCEAYIKCPEICDAQEKIYCLKFNEAPPQSQGKDDNEEGREDQETIQAKNKEEEKLDSNAAEKCEEDSLETVFNTELVLHNNEETIQAAPRKEEESESSQALSSSAAGQGEEKFTPVVIFWNPLCEKHCIPDHPEQPLRVNSILERLKRSYPSSSFRTSREIASHDVLRFHTADHLQKFITRCEDVERKSEASGRESYCAIDSDTTICQHTRRAALSAAGAVLDAVDALFNASGRKVGAAFCCVRPPGHHATPSASMGFCFLNNAAIGAKYAQEVYQVKKVAVLDFDVHHGNGTEDGFKSDPTLFYGSTHEKDNYPYSGEEPSHKADKAKKEVDRRIVNRFLFAGKSSAKQFRVKWKEVVSEMIRFAPDLVIISAGFDAHEKDPIGNCYLQDEDFAWATQEIVDACALIKPEDPPPILSVLEGGYNLEAISSAAAAHVDVLHSSFKDGPQSSRQSTKKKGDEVEALVELMKRDLKL